MGNEINAVDSDREFWCRQIDWLLCFKWLEEAGVRPKALAELAQAYDVHPNQITDWKTLLLERSAAVFGDRPAKENGPDIQTMQAKIDQLTLENDFLERALTKSGMLSAKR